MKKTMILALSAMIMAAGTVTVNAQEKVVTLDQILKKNQEQKEAPKEVKKETTKQEQAPAKTTQAKAVKETKSKAPFSHLSAASGYNLVYVQYNAETMKYSKSGNSSSTSYNSVSAGFARVFGVSTAPIMLEAGVAAKYIWKDKDGVKDNMLSVKTPINVIYPHAFSDAFSLEPYAGFYLRLNVLGKRKVSGGGGSYYDDDDDYWGDDDYWDDDDEGYWEGPSGKSSIDLFSKDDMGDNRFKRFQMGIQVGVRARINNKFVVGVGYSQDMLNITDHTKFNSWDFTLGFCF